MARTDKFSIQRGTLNDIGDAIREKRGYNSNRTIYPGDMPSEIRGIKTGGGIDIAVGYNNDKVNPDDFWNSYVSTEQKDSYRSFFMDFHAGYNNELGGSILSGEDTVNLFCDSTGEDSAIVLLYDVENITSNPWIGVYVEAEGEWRIRRMRYTGSWELYGSGNEHAFQGNNYFRQALVNGSTSIDDEQVWVITGVGITKFGFCTSTASSSTSEPNNSQPCVFKAASLPKLLTMDSIAGSTNPTEICWTTKWLVYENVVAGQIATWNIGEGDFEHYGIRSMYHTWENATSLETLDDYLSPTPPSDYAGSTDYTVPLALDYLFSNCVSLRSVSLAQMFGTFYNDFNYATVSSMEYAFNNCYMLRYVGLIEENPEGGTYRSVRAMMDEYGENIVPYSMSHCFNNCYSLNNFGRLELNPDFFYINDYSYCFNNCYNLKCLVDAPYSDSSWFTGYSLESMDHMFANCYSLQSFHVGGVSFENFASLENVDYMFYNCQSLTDVQIFDPAGGAFPTVDDTDTFNSVRTFNHMFDGCSSLKKIEFPFWLGTGDPMYSFSYMFANCSSLEYIDIEQFGRLIDSQATNYLDRIKIEDVSYMFYNCYSLKDFKDSYGIFSSSTKIGFNMPKKYNDDWYWNIKKMDHMFENCYSIEVLHLENWFPSTSHSYPRQNDPDPHYINEVDYTDALKNLKKLKHLTFGQKLPNISSSANVPGLSLQNCPNFMYIVAWYSPLVSFGIYDCPNFTKYNLLNVISNLQTAGAGTTPVLTIGSEHMAKLTSADIAVATQKGWTVA